RLAAMANMSVSRLSHLLDRLSDRGWVERRPDPTDGRSTMAVLTDAGWDKVVATAPGHVDNVRSLVFEGLTAEQITQLKQISATISGRLDPERKLGAVGTVRRGTDTDPSADRRNAPSPDRGGLGQREAVTVALERRPVPLEHQRAGLQHLVQVEAAEDDAGEHLRCRGDDGVGTTVLARTEQPVHGLDRELPAQDAAVQGQVTEAEPDPHTDALGLTR